MRRMEASSRTVKENCERTIFRLVFEYFTSTADALKSMYLQSRIVDRQALDHDLDDVAVANEKREYLPQR